MREHSSWFDIKKKLEKMEEREKSKFEFVESAGDFIFFLEKNDKDIFFQKVNLKTGEIYGYSCRKDRFLQEGNRLIVGKKNLKKVI